MTRLLKSVRVRMTLAAMGVTAIAVGLTGWLLVRTVEDDQLGQVQDDTESQVDGVAEMLANGADPQEAVAAGGSDIAIGLIEIRDDRGTLVASNPTAGATREGEVMLIERRVDALGVEGWASAGGGGGGGDPAGGGDFLLPDPSALCLLDPEMCAPECVVGITDCAGDLCAPEPEETYTVRCPEPPPGQSTVAVPAGPVLFRTEPLEEISKTVDTDMGPLTVTATAPVSEVERSVEAVQRSLWLLLPGLVGIVALAGWWMTGRALRPIEAIRLEAEAIGGSTIHRRVPEPATGDEIGRMAQTMNAMLERLDHSARRQRQFVSDASHELRSPLAAIRTDVEVALREGDAANWPEVARDVLQEESRLETLLADLLVLAADDEGKNGMRTDPVDLAELVADVVEDGELAAGGQTHSVFVLGHANQLRRAVGNLVTNARRHATSRVSVAVSVAAGRVQVIIDDDGPGIPPADRDRVFQRFTRLDNGRARDQGGSGLGLAVVRSIAVRHGGRVWADAGPLGGARFTLDLPVASS